MTSANQRADTWDVIIVGQGLAGTTLAWLLEEAGQRVMLLDADEPITSSRIAAGLITPITGQRLTLNWSEDHVWQAVRGFYRRIEDRTGARFFHDRLAIRLFASDGERQLWVKRQTEPGYQPHLITPQPWPLLDPDISDTSGGGFAMTAAQLDVAAYLEASRAVLPVRTQRIDWTHDVHFDGDSVRVGSLRARRLIACEGAAAASNPYFAAVPFRSAKGEILTIRLARPLPPVSLHRGIWMAPTGDPAVFRVGATYAWDQLDTVPTRAGRGDIEAGLQAVLRRPYDVIGHEAAVRPIIAKSKALMGWHPHHQRLGYFNGLASKGALRAPWFATQFARAIVAGAPIAADVDVRRFVV